MRAHIPLFHSSQGIIPVTAANWRLYITANNWTGAAPQNDSAEIIEIIPILEDFSRSPFSGGSASASSSYYGDNGSRAFDDNESVYWDSANGQTYPHTVGYANPTTKKPLCFRISSQASNVLGFIQYAPKNFEIQYSLDSGATWHKWAGYANILTQPNSDGINYFWRQFLGGYFYQDGTYSMYPPAPSLKKEWLVWITSNNGGSLTQAVDIQMLDDNDVNQCTGGVVSFSTQYATSGVGAAANAFDGSTTTKWDTRNSGFPCFIGYRWTSTKEITKMKVIGCVAGETNRSIKDIKILYSDPASATGWTEIYAANGLTWSGLEEKIFDFYPPVNAYLAIVGSYKQYSTPNGWLLYISNLGYLVFNWSESSGNKWTGGTTQKVRKNRWTHIAVRKIGTNIYLYVDELQDATVYTTAGELIGTSDYPVTIGWSNPVDNMYFKGSQGQIRITKAARPVSVPQTIFPENITDDPYWNDVIFLTKPSGGVLTDLKGHTLTSHDGAALDAANPHFSLSTTLLNGTTQYYDAGIDLVLNSLGTSDLTIEAWVYCT